MFGSHLCLNLGKENRSQRVTKYKTIRQEGVWCAGKVPRSQQGQSVGRRWSMKDMKSEKQPQDKVFVEQSKEWKLYSKRNGKPSCTSLWNVVTIWAKVAKSEHLPVLILCFVWLWFSGQCLIFCNYLLPTLGWLQGGMKPPILAITGWEDRQHSKYMS